MIGAGVWPTLAIAGLIAFLVVLGSLVALLIVRGSTPPPPPPPPRRQPWGRDWPWDDDAA